MNKSRKYIEEDLELVANFDELVTSLNTYKLPKSKVRNLDLVFAKIKSAIEMNKSGKIAISSLDVKKDISSNSD